MLDRQGKAGQSVGAGRPVRQLRAGHEGIPEGPGRLATQAGWLDRQACKAD